jgi:biopolymer transport protein ExbB/TolQ
MRSEQQQRRQLVIVALPLAVAAVLISLLVAGLTYLELAQRASEAERVARETRALADAVSGVQKGREAALQASNQAQVDNCYSRNAQGPALVRLLFAVRETLDADGRATIDDFITQMRETTPTVRECHRLADELKLPRRRTP